MFLPEHQSEAKQKGHMTVDDAARVASRAGVQRLVLTHLSPRYREEDVKNLHAAAVKRFPGAEMGQDLRSYPVDLRNN